MQRPLASAVERFSRQSASTRSWLHSAAAQRSYSTSKDTELVGARMHTAVILHAGRTGRVYRTASPRDYAAVRDAQVFVEKAMEQWAQGGSEQLCPIPNEPVGRVPAPFGVINFWVYGLLEWGDLFTARQKAVLILLLRLIQRRWQSCGKAICLARAHYQGIFATLQAFPRTLPPTPSILPCPNP